MVGPASSLVQGIKEKVEENKETKKRWVKSKKRINDDFIQSVSIADLLFNKSVWFKKYNWFLSI
jgi:hypothetical protein